MKCLACWEPISEEEKICHHCGTDQNNAKDYLALALMKQQKNKVAVPEKTKVLDYIYKVDPEAKEEITISSSVSTLTTPSSSKPQIAAPVSKTPSTQSGYQPQVPSWLGTPSPKALAEISKEAKEQPKVKTKAKQKEKTLICPNCEKEAPLRKFCKHCGNPLQKECPKCNKSNSIKAKFCTACGQNITATSLDKEEKKQ
ncbi:MAG: zinc ribbon domain-containing protein [Asgard group archaeon]|nr:zinc ribbon domain-containing protein [Asgard group archaeon]